MPPVLKTSRIATRMHRAGEQGSGFLSATLPRMRGSGFARVWIVVAAAVALLLALLAAWWLRHSIAHRGEQALPLRIVADVPLQTLTGKAPRFDFATIDPARRLLFVAY